MINDQNGNKVKSADFKKKYQQLAKKSRPKKPVVKNLLGAFFVGGLICTVGQGVQSIFVSYGMSETTAAGPTTVVMIGIGALLTGLGWYDRIVKIAGMGGSLPITGFANAMVAPAMEFKEEGLIMGVGARLFTVAGPVLAWGLGAAFIIGLIRYFVMGGA